MSKSSRNNGRKERAAAIQAAQARTERNRRLALVGAVVVVIAVIAAAVFWYSGSSDSGTASSGKGYGKVPARVVSLDDAPAKTVSTAGGDGSTRALVIGDKSAKLKVVVYEDFLCPYCHEFEESSRDFLHAAAAKGKVEVEYRPFHLLQPQYSLDSLNAFEAALKSATPTNALRFHDLLYDNQPYENASSFPDAAKIAKWAESVGVDGDDVSSAVQADDTTYAQAVEALAKKAKVPGTPTIFVNGKMLAGSSVAEMVENLQTMIGKA